ncbi:MAG TPA: SpoIID/LytB domain-containing protein [Baekduia sp.]|uniref:SpoIID/LytB domain-containing protein n=1 Tax=Baekduia sp. TaxID=2600305 RepID=UPI002CC737FF|nr:SpoIID/LytB domain-containing protein [Baekduia sp.]HMJ33901.1 SpoIID/LytB domain-containing protein [Baekduia sp.]
MRRILTATAAVQLAALGCASAAPAASQLVIKGHGYGHGIGMSQYGALGFAQHGSSYREILDHYYEQTQVAPLASAPDVRVLLKSGTRAVVSGVVAGGPRKLRATSTYSAGRAAGGRVALYSASGRRLGTYAAPLRLAAPSTGALTLHGSAANGLRDGRYRGAIEVRPTSSGVLAINAVGLEDYVRGVVSAESPSSWPAEALKAQAVAARSYAVTTNVGTTTDGFDQYADTRSQVYKGVAAEFPATDAAVAATRGEVVMQGGQPVTTYFFSTSGGHTENIEFSFVGSLPRTWLKGVDDPYDGVSPRHTWGPFTFSQSRAETKLKGLVRGKFRGITVLQRGSSPRVVRAEIDGTNGVTQVTGPELRKRFGLYDTWATFTYISSDAKQPATGGDPSADGPSSTTPASTTVPAGTSTTAGGSTLPDAIDTTGGQAASIARMSRPVLSGSIQPARRGRTLRVQRHDAGGWRTVGTTIVGQSGSYRTSLPGPGDYRVALGDVVGPAVNVR